MIEPNNIYQGDCLEVMDGIADKSIDAMIKIGEQTARKHQAELLKVKARCSR